jgi:hypothetical protein
MLWLPRIATSSLLQLGHRGPPSPASSPASIALFDDLIRPQQQRRRDREAESLRRLEVDDELETRCLLYWQVFGLNSL